MLAKMFQAIGTYNVHGGKRREEYHGAVARGGPRPLWSTSLHTRRTALQGEPASKWNWLSRPCSADATRLRRMRKTIPMTAHDTIAAAQTTPMAAFFFTWYMFALFASICWVTVRFAPGVPGSHVDVFVSK